MHFIGIDLSWKSKGYSGICIIDAQQQIKHWEVNTFSNDQLVHLIELYAKKGAIISIDAPLSVENEEGSRACENEFKRTKINGQFASIFSSNRRFMLKVFGEIRGADLLSNIRTSIPSFAKPQKDYFIFETFPTGICLGTFQKKINYKVSNAKRKEILLESLQELVDAFNDHFWFSKLKNPIEATIRPYLNEKPTLKELKLLDDKIDALLCAYCSWQYYFHSTEILTFGKGDEQLIITKN